MHAVFFVEHVVAPVGLAGVDHGGEFQRRGIIAYNAADVVLLAKFPAPNLSRAMTLPSAL